MSKKRLLAIAAATLALGLSLTPSAFAGNYYNAGDYDGPYKHGYYRG